MFDRQGLEVDGDPFHQGWGRRADLDEWTPGYNAVRTHLGSEAWTTPDQDRDVAAGRQETRPHTSLGCQTPAEFASSAGVNPGR